MSSPAKSTGGKKNNKELNQSQSATTLARGQVNNKLGVGTKGVKSDFIKLPPSLLRHDSSDRFSVGSLSNILDDDDDEEFELMSRREKKVEMRKMWLKVIAHSVRLACFDNYCKCSFEAIHEKVSHSRQVYMAMLRASAFVLARARWVKIRVARRKEIFRKHGWRIILYWQCKKRREAASAVRRFFSDHRSFRLAFMMLRFRQNALALQKRVRSFIQVNNARVHVLTKLWIKIEKKVRDSFLPKLKQLQSNQSPTKQLEAQKCEAWEANKLTGIVLPNLATHINSATKSAIQLKKIMNDGKELQKKVSAAEMSRRVKHLKEKKKTGHVPKAKKRRKKKKNVVSVDSMSVRERAIRNFLSECRRSFKTQKSYEMPTLHRENTAKTNQIPADLALRLIKCKNVQDMRSVEVAIQELMAAEAEMAQHLHVFTGENAGKFYCIVEEYVKRKIDEMMMMC